jgi:hypothetical protein
MAITNYTNLQTSIADFLNRDDLTPIIPTFIQLAEAQFNRDLRHWRQEARATGQQTAGDEYMQIPFDWLETIRFQVTAATSPTGVLTDKVQPIDMISRAAMLDKRKANNIAGTPTHYCMADAQFHLYPTPDLTYDMELLYYAKVPELSTNITTNWLLEYAPDAYLYGSLLHSAPYLQEDARVNVWAQLYSAVMQRLNQESEDATASGSGLTLKIRGLG